MKKSIVIGFVLIVGFAAAQHKPNSIQVRDTAVRNWPDSLSPQLIGKEKTILLDRYFNSEKRNDSNGVSVYWHYVWEEESYPGFSVFGNIFKRYGASLASIDEAPTTGELNKASVYIIVDPDHIKDNPSPNYITDKDVNVIVGWVKAGGVLLLMANDSANCDLEHFNKLSLAFGIRFTGKNLNMVKDDHYETGGVLPGTNNIVFKQTKKMFLKDISVLEIRKPATALIKKKEDIVIATAKYGKGTVLAVGDPWLYNEYADGRKLPAEYENYKAAEDLAKWLLKSSTHRVF